MTKLSGSHHELNKINNIRAKSSDKYDSSSSNSYSSDYDSSLSSDIERDKRINPSEHKDMNKLYHVVTNKIKNKYQCNDTIEHEPKFDNIFILSIRTKDPASSNCQPPV